MLLFAASIFNLVLYLCQAVKKILLTVAIKLCDNTYICPYNKREKA
jgi:hypothetical protein